MHNEISNFRWYIIGYNLICFQFIETVSELHFSTRKKYIFSHVSSYPTPPYYFLWPTLRTINYYKRRIYFILDVFNSITIGSKLSLQICVPPRLLPPPPTTTTTITPNHPPTRLLNSERIKVRPPPPAHTHTHARARARTTQPNPPVFHVRNNSPIFLLYACVIPRKGKWMGGVR